MTSQSLPVSQYIDDANWGSVATTPDPSRTSSAEEPTAFQPTYFFFYGTLMMPSLLQRVLKLHQLPVLLKASTGMFRLKMWGPFPALVKSESNSVEGNATIVEGVAYLVASAEHLQRLITYEGENYSVAEAVMEIFHPPDGKMKTVYGKTFTWNGYPEELKDGVFDISAFRDQW